MDIRGIMQQQQQQLQQQDLTPVCLPCAMPLWGMQHLLLGPQRTHRICPQHFQCKSQGAGADHVEAAGKTTLLRMIAGLESTSSGQIMFDGESPAAAQFDSRFLVKQRKAQHTSHTVPSSSRAGLLWPDDECWQDLRTRLQPGLSAAVDTAGSTRLAQSRRADSVALTATGAA